METNKKQTAVEWLQEQIKDIQPYELACTIEQYIDEAKQMEREQIVEANIAGMEFIPVDPDMYNKDANQYYEETYGKET